MHTAAVVTVNRLADADAVLRYCRGLGVRFRYAIYSDTPIIRVFDLSAIDFLALKASVSDSPIDWL